MRTRSPARSRLRAPAWPDELTPSRVLAADQGLDGPSANPLSLVGTERIAIEKVISLDHVFVAQIDEPNVRVESGCDVALVGEAEALGDVGGGRRGDHRQLELATCEQQLPGRLAA